MNRKLTALALATAVAVPTAGLTNAEAHHGTKTGDANKIKVTGGSTELALNDAAKGALSSQGITTAKDPATLAGDSLTFPIAGGRLKTTNPTAVLFHKGGVTFTKGDRSLKLRGVTIGTDSAGHGAVWALVGHRFRAAFKPHGRKLGRAAHHGRHVRWHFRWHVARVLALTNVKRTDEIGKSTITADAALTGQGAKLLDRKLGTTAFHTGDAVGTVTSTATTG